MVVLSQPNSTSYAQVSEYQVASNARAQERVKELLEEKKRRAQRDREGREKVWLAGFFFSCRCSEGPHDFRLQ